MNFTLSALSVSFYFSFPMISPASSSSLLSKQSFHQVHMKNFFTNFFLDHSNLASMTFSYSSFINFLKTPIAIERHNEYKITYKNYTNQQYQNADIFTVIGCNFKDCVGGSDKDGYIRGGAIKYLSNNNLGNVTVYGSTFENCQTAKGDGGAIFVCKEERISDFDSTHTLTNYFNSSYCCYSKCTAYRTDNERKSGYGPVMFIFATTIEIFYSTAVECPKEGQSFGAQFDLKSSAIRSSYINSTKGNSTYCCAMEYREAKDGYFKYQTFNQLTGGFLSSFTDLDKGLDISYCNYINNTIAKPDNQKGAFIYVRNTDVLISHFCFVDIEIKGEFEFVHFSAEGHNITLSDSYVDKNIGLDNVDKKNVHFYDENEEEKYTNLIELLGLGPCEGQITPPPTIFSKTFKPTSYFTPSFDFTESKGFSETKKFSESDKFTLSGIFSASKNVVDRDPNLQDSNDDKKLPTGAIVGIAIAAAAVVAIIVAAFFIIRAKMGANIISEGADMNDIETNSVNTANPLYGEGADDPFKEDFNNDLN